eukprot:838963-Rhodomonas_salina.1
MCDTAFTSPRSTCHHGWLWLSVWVHPPECHCPSRPIPSKALAALPECAVEIWLVVQLEQSKTTGSGSGPIWAQGLHVKLPAVFVHSAFEQVADPELHSSTSAHVAPSPSYPALQVHETPTRTTSSTNTL